MNVPKWLENLRAASIEVKHHRASPGDRSLNAVDCGNETRTRESAHETPLEKEKNRKEVIEERLEA